MLIFKHFSSHNRYKLWHKLSELFGAKQDELQPHLMTRRNNEPKIENFYFLSDFERFLVFLVFLVFLC